MALIYLKSDAESRDSHFDGQTNDVEPKQTNLSPCSPNMAPQVPNSMSSLASNDEDMLPIPQINAKLYVLHIEIKEKNGWI